MSRAASNQGANCYEYEDIRLSCSGIYGFKYDLLWMAVGGTHSYTHGNCHPDYSHTSTQRHCTST